MKPGDGPIWRVGQRRGDVPVTVVSTRFAVDAYPASQLHLAVRVAARLRLVFGERGEFVLLEDVEDAS